MISKEKLDLFEKDHKTFLEKISEGKTPSILINAFGGAGAGKSTACLNICAELKKMGFVAEYVSEYSKDLVWEENWDLLDGTEAHQFEILTEQLKRQDRLYGKVDFIVTDAPILLNKVYNKELTPEYEKMLRNLYAQYTSFNFVVERDASKYEQEGRMQSLQESIEKDNEIKKMLDSYGLFYGVYQHKTIDKIVDNAVKTFNRVNGTGKTQDSGEKTPSYRQLYQGRIYPRQYGDSPLYVCTSDDREDLLSKLNLAFQKEREFAKPVCYIDRLYGKEDYINIEKYDMENGLNLTKVYLNVNYDNADELAKIRSYDCVQFDKNKQKFFVEKYLVGKLPDFLKTKLPTKYIKEFQGKAYRQDDTIVTLYADNEKTLLSSFLRWNETHPENNKQIRDIIFINKYNPKSYQHESYRQYSLKEERTSPKEKNDGANRNMNGKQKNKGNER